MVGLAPPWRAARVLEPLESSGSLYLYMRNIRGELEPCARYRTPNPLPVPPARRGRAAFPSPSNRRFNRFGGMGDATCLWGSLARVTLRVRPIGNRPTAALVNNLPHNPVHAAFPQNGQAPPSKPRPGGGGNACYDVAEKLFLEEMQTWVRWVGRKWCLSFSSR